MNILHIGKEIFSGRTKETRGFCTRQNCHMGENLGRESLDASDQSSIAQETRSSIVRFSKWSYFCLSFLCFFSRTMKKWMVLLGGAMFCVLFFSMYLVVDQLGRLPTSQEIFKVEVNLWHGIATSHRVRAFFRLLCHSCMNVAVFKLNL